MASPQPHPPDDRRRRWWTALGGVVLFVVLGLVLAPGLARREPALAQPPGLQEARAAQAEGVAPAGSTARPAAPPQRSAPAAAVARVDRGAEPGAAHTRPPAARPALDVDAFDCMILASEAIEIGSAVADRIAEIPVERGDYVEAGHVVVRLESKVEQAAVQVARARARSEGQLEFAAANLELGRKRRARALELFDLDSISLAAREEVETEADLAASELKRAREQHRVAALELDEALAALERRTIRSPVSGFVVERRMAPGEVAVDEATILRIAQTDPLRVEVILPSELFGRIEPGDRAEVVPEAPLGSPGVAEVTIVDRVIDGPSGTFGARLLLPNPDHDLPAGLRCQVRFLGDDDGQGGKGG